jgi:hypothetical protein
VITELLLHKALLVSLIHCGGAGAARIRINLAEPELVQQRDAAPKSAAPRAVALTYTYRSITKIIVASSVAELEPHHLVGAGAVTRCGSGSESDGSDSDNGIEHG